MRAEASPPNSDAVDTDVRARGEASAGLATDRSEGIPERILEQAIALYLSGSAGEALPLLREAHERDPGHARMRSFYGLCLGVHDRAFESALELCRSAVKQEFFNPELYLNLARLHMSFGFKAEAIRYLRRGKMIDPGDVAISQALVDLGERRRQVLGFLPRQHMLNRLLGRARNRIGLGGSEVNI